MTRMCSFLGAAVIATMASTAFAQPAPFAPAASDQLRHQIYLMEGMLARAVTSGASRLNAQFRAVMPDMTVLAGESNARGFQLENYGVFFDVEVPVLRQSMMWSLRTILDHDDQQAANALAALRTFIARSSGQERAAAEASLQLLEAELRPFQMISGRTGGPGLPAAEGGRVPANARPVPGAPDKPAINPLLLQDPNKAYTDAVVQALIEAMVDNALPMVSFLPPEAYLTVAARDNERRDLLAPPNPYEQVSTFTLRIKAADLAAYRAGKIDRDEAKKRVEIKEF